MKKYLLGSLLISLFLSALFFFNSWLFNGYLHDQYLVLIGFFFGQSIVVSWMLFEGEKDRSRLPLYALGSIAFRFLTGVFLLLIFMLAEVVNLENLTVQFMALYFVYLAFELTAVLSNLRRNSG